MERNLLKLFTKKELRDIFKTYGKHHRDYEFMKVTKSFEVDGKEYKEGDILYMVDYPYDKTRAIILNRYLYQHNDFLDIRYLEEKNNKWRYLLNNRCWWLENWCHRHLEPIVKSNFLYER